MQERRRPAVALDLAVDDECGDDLHDGEQERDPHHERELQQHHEWQRQQGARRGRTGQQRDGASDRERDGEFGNVRQHGAQDQDLLGEDGVHRHAAHANERAHAAGRALREMRVVNDAEQREQRVVRNRRSEPPVEDEVQQSQQQQRVEEAPEEAERGVLVADLRLRDRDLAHERPVARAQGSERPFRHGLRRPVRSGAAAMDSGTRRPSCRPRRRRRGTHRYERARSCSAARSR